MMGAVTRDPLTETFDAVLFDNDSTLVDSHASVERTWQSWARAHGVTVRMDEIQGMRSSAIIAQVAPHLDNASATAEFDQLELDDLDGVTALPGAAEALAAVGDRVAIVTSAGRELFRRRLVAAGLAEPEVTVTAEDVRHGKPDPEPYLVGARRMGVDPSRCLVVEDSVAGLRAGRGAGAATVAVVTTTDPALLADHADLVVTDLSELRFEVVGDAANSAVAVRRR